MKHRFLIFVFVVVLLSVAISFIGCGGGSDHYYILSTDNGIISGNIYQSFANPSLRMQAGFSTTPAVNADVWLEEMPERIIQTNSEGRYLFTNLPVGFYRVVARLSEATTLFKARSEREETKVDRPISIDLTLFEAKNKVQGVLKDPEGVPLPQGTKLYLWGEEFKVGLGGSFLTPPLPVYSSDDVINDILVEHQDSNVVSIPVSFASEKEVSVVELIVPENKKSETLIPNLAVWATENQTVVSEIFSNSMLRIVAKPFPLNQVELDWSATHGVISESDIHSGETRERIWTSPAMACVATITVKLTLGEQFVSVSLPIGVKGPKTYKVIYNGNGNSTGTVPIDNNFYLPEAKFTVLDNTNLAKEGFIFSGWNSEPDGSGISYEPQREFTIGIQNLTLYAKWKNEPEYSITYDGNGNTSGEVPIDNDTYKKDELAVVHKNYGSLVKDGYDFDGWNTEQDGKGTFYRENSALKVANSNIVLYAYWRPKPRYRIFYDGNDNTIGEVPLDNNSYLAGEKALILGRDTLGREAYSFDGWNSRANGEGIDYQEGQVITIASESITLYAKWVKSYQYRVVYAGNNNTGGEPPSDPDTYRPGEEVTVRGIAIDFIRKGYTFAGWTTRSDGTDAALLAGSTFLMGSSDLTLYAKWVRNPTYSVSYSGQGSTWGDPPIDQEEYEEGATVTVRGNTGNLIRDEYVFSGWTTEAGGTGTRYSPGNTFQMGTKNVTLYALWEKGEVYRVTYELNAYDVKGKAPVDTKQYKAGETVTVKSSSLTRDSHDFLGWTKVKDGPSPFAAGDEFLIAKADVILFAKWVLKPAYSVTYNKNTATGNEPKDPNSYQANSDATVLDKGNLDKAGYAFAGWNTKANGTGIAYQPNEKIRITSENVVLYAVWQKAYTVTYNGNQNQAGIAPVDSNLYSPNSYVTILDNYGNLARTGYTFEGWSKNASGTGTIYQAGDITTMPTANLVLFAHWKQISSYTVSYNGNGETAGTPPVDISAYNPGSIVIIRGPSSLSKTGYTFVCWNTKANGSGYDYQAGDEYAMNDGDIEFYAQWKPVTTVTFTYDGNGHTSGTSPLHLVYTVYSTVHAPNNGDLVKTGYSFKYWNTLANGSGNVYRAGDPIEVGISSIILYAIWEENPRYTITYDKNGALSGNPPLDTATYEEGALVTVLGNLVGTPDELILPSHTFAGWTLYPDGSGPLYEAGEKITMESINLRLYAKWHPNPTYQVVYLGNGSTEGAPPIDSNAYEEGENVTVLSCPPTLKKILHSFVTWNTKEDGTGINYSDGDIFVIGASDINLYAIWSLNPTFSVTYDGNGATEGDPPLDEKKYEVSSEVVVKALPVSLKKDEHTFVAWNTKADGTGSSYSAGYSFYMPSDDVTLYAIWQQNPPYFVIYNANGATGGVPPTDITEYQNGDNVTVKTNSGFLQKTKHTFEGWNSKADGTGTQYDEGSTFTMGVTSVTLYAKWTPNPRVIYQGNGNTGGSVPVDNNSYEFYSTVTVKGNIGSLTKVGFVFAGWNTKSNGTGISYQGGDELNVGKQDVTLYAKWN